MLTCSLQSSGLDTTVLPSTRVVAMPAVGPPRQENFSIVPKAVAPGSRGEKAKILKRVLTEYCGEYEAIALDAMHAHGRHLRSREPSTAPLS